MLEVGSPQCTMCSIAKWFSRSHVHVLDQRASVEMSALPIASSLLSPVVFIDFAFVLL